MGDDVVIVGAGVIGLTAARALARGGARVRVIDRGPAGAGSTQAAGAILSPTDPAEWAAPLGPYNVAAIERWPAWAAALADATGRDSGLDVPGELRLARTDADAAFVAAAAAGAAAAGWAHAALDAGDVRRREPGLAHAGGALHLPGTAAVRVDALVAALVAACESLGVAFVRGEVTAAGGGARVRDSVTGGARVRGSVTGGARVRLASGEELRAGTVLLAGGAWLGQAWVDPAVRPPVAPLLGEAIVLAPAAPVCTHVIRSTAGSIVPRADGTVYAGTTLRERGFQAGADLGSVRAVAERAVALLPALDGARFVAARAGLRPASADGRPFVGPAADGVVLAGGHGREGVIHAPLCADGLARGILDGDWSLVPDAFRPAPERLAGGS